VARSRPPAPEHEHEITATPVDLRAKGKRLTRQRQLIWDALVSEPESHLSAEDVVERVRVHLAQVNASTIYRTLELLVEEGLLLRTDLGGDRAYYEPAREHAHHHLVCERCGRVQHLHDEQLGDLRKRIERSSGFAVGSGELTLFGLCSACQEADARRQSLPRPKSPALD
jgi:Fur family transcriptional regulator, ferric uptake regulator